MQRQQLIGRARELRAAGETYESIARELGVNEKTIRRWLGGAAKRGPTPDWPDDRIWPAEWTTRSLLDLPDFDASKWEANIAMIRSAQAQGNVHIPWFYRRLVELERERVASSGDKSEIAWALTAAALPPLGHKIGCEEACNKLAALTREKKPWEGGGLLRRSPQRAEYLREAEPWAGKLRECILLAQALYVTRDLGDDTMRQGPILLGALHERVPDFDRTPRLSFYRIYPLASILLGVLALPNLPERG